MIVADVNLLAYLLIPAVQTAEAVAVYRRDPDWAMPYIWRSEFRNVLATYMRVRNLPLADAEIIWESAAAAVRESEHEPDPRLILALCRQYAITAYDAEYLSLARQQRVPLVTFDKKLQKSALGEVLSVSQFLRGSRA